LLEDDEEGWVETLGDAELAHGELEGPVEGSNQGLEAVALRKLALLERRPRGLRRHQATQMASSKARWMAQTRKSKKEDCPIYHFKDDEEGCAEITVDSELPHSKLEGPVDGLDKALEEEHCST
jgi:hypothetical protein